MYETRDLLRTWSDGWADCIGRLLGGRPRDRVAATRYCRLMDGLALEVVLGAPPQVGAEHAGEGPSLEVLDLQARYEREYSKYRNLPQPKILAADIARWGEVARAANIKMEQQ